VGFAAEGASVSLSGRNVEALERVAADCKRAGAEAIYTPGEITSDDNLKELVDHTVSKFGKIDILVNCAGVVNPPCTILNPNFEEYDKCLNTNLRN